MSTATLGLILTSVTLSALAQMLFKFGLTSVSSASPPLESGISVFFAMLFSPGVLGGLTLYGVGTILWLGALSRTELSQAYPFVGLGFVLTAVIGTFVFHDGFGALRLAGTILVVVGVLLVGLS